MSKETLLILLLIVCPVILILISSYFKLIKKSVKAKKYQAKLALEQAMQQEEPQEEVNKEVVLPEVKEEVEEIEVSEEQEEAIEEVVEEVKEEKPSKKRVKNEKFEAIKNKVKKVLKVFVKEVIKHPLYLLSHPIQGFTEFKNEKKGKAWVAWTIILLYVLMNIVAYQYEGIVTNSKNPQEFNSILILVYGVLPPVLIAVANWSVTTLLDGKGKIGEIFKMIGYSLFPVMILGYFNIILSNVLTLDEAQFIMLINIVGWVLTCYMVFMGLIVIHEYGMAKTLLSVIFTAVALLIIAFVALLIFDLAQQMYGFVYSLYQEISMRFL